MYSSSRIRILPDEAVNKVAAGEVVERPAAALKELVENSLDAGATRVQIAIERSGRSLIRVRDDGSGMTHDDLLLAIERHSTSKITAVEDLQRIGTFGFRGEALPSIAAVSRMQIKSRTAAEVEGTSVLMNGGRVLKVSPCGVPPGTEVEVRSLFRNVPARLKFLKSNATELSHCLMVSSRLALAYPEVDFTLTHGTRTLLRLPAAAGRGERIGAYAGDEFLGNLLPLSRCEGRIALSGFLCRPGSGRAGSDYQLFFVNSRPVRDGLLLKAAKESCREYFLKERDPLSFFLWIDLPADEVDVNVHPTKREVRFRDFSALRGVLDRALRETLRQDRVSWVMQPAPSTAGSISAEAGASFTAQGISTVENPLLPGTDPQPSAASPLTPAGGQLFSTYLVALRPEGLIIIDQHAAHERILYERMLARLEEGKSQRLLDPPTLDLAPAEAELLGELRESIAACGLEVERSGTASFRVLAVPPDLPPERSPGFIRELVASAGRGEASPKVADFRHRLAALMACHASVRAGESLQPRAAQTLIQDLFGTAEPAHCPHGRPTFVRLDRREIEKKFKRR